MNITNIRNMVKRDIHESGVTQTQFAENIRLHSKTLSAFICMKIQYVPEAILKHYGLKKKMVVPKITYVKDE